MIKLLCIQEARSDDDGTKTMSFTKGRTYYAEEFTDHGDPFWEVAGDNGFKETFWNLNVMFERV